MKPKTDKLLSDVEKKFGIRCGKHHPRLKLSTYLKRKGYSSMSRLLEMTKPKTDKQGWEIDQISRRLARMATEMVGTDEASCYLMFKKEITPILSHQREQVRRETVEETLRGYVANEQLIESRRNDCSKGTIMWSKFAAEILNKYWFNKALSSDGEKKGER